MPNSRTGATSQPQTRSASLDAIARIAGLAAACGASEAGGPLAAAELELLRQAAPVSTEDVDAVRNAILDGGDPLGAEFLAVRSAERRRADGAFYTGAEIRRAMLGWAMQFRPGRLVDPGCGSGRFTADALREQPEMHVVAIDADPVAALMTRAVVATLRAPNVRVVCANYLSVSLDPFAGRTAFVGNPPYVRHHDLAPALKQYAKMLAREAGLNASGLSGLHAWFFVATHLRHAAQGDIGAFVTSAQWLDARYGAVVRDLLSGPLGGRSLLSFDAASSPFEAMTTAAIATFEIGKTVDSMLFGTADISDTRFDLERTGIAIDGAVLRRSQRWSELFDTGEPDEIGGHTIGSSFRVSRGQVTGDNSFFVLTRERAQELQIDEFCVPVIASAREVFSSDGVIENALQRRVALRIPRAVDPAGVPALARYLAEGEARGVHRGYIASRRKPWYSIDYPRPPIVATYMARRPPCFAYNPDGLGVLNVLHGLYPRECLTERALRSTVKRLNSLQTRFARHGRVYHGGLRKFEPSDLSAVAFESS
jgi:adenine-specific DNA-methyltransferase